MPVERLPHHESHFTILDNLPIEDSRLSFRARGLLHYMLGRPPHWVFYVKELAKHGTEGEGAIRTVLGELKQFGYVTETRSRKDNGQLGKQIYTAHEIPVLPIPDELFRDHFTTFGKWQRGENSEVEQKPSKNAASSPVSAESATSQDLAPSKDLYLENTDSSSKYVSHPEKTDTGYLLPQGTPIATLIETAAKTAIQSFFQEIAKNETTTTTTDLVAQVLAKTQPSIQMGHQNMTSYVPQAQASSPEESPVQKGSVFPVTAEATVSTPSPAEPSVEQEQSPTQGVELACADQTVVMGNPGKETERTRFYASGTASGANSMAGENTLPETSPETVECAIKVIQCGDDSTGFSDSNQTSHEPDKTIHLASGEADRPIGMTAQQAFDLYKAIGLGRPSVRVGKFHSPVWQALLPKITSDQFTQAASICLGPRGKAANIIAPNYLIPVLEELVAGTLDAHGEPVAKPKPPGYRKPSSYQEQKDPTPSIRERTARQTGDFQGTAVVSATPESYQGYFIDTLNKYFDVAETMDETVQRLRNQGVPRDC